MDISSKNKLTCVKRNIRELRLGGKLQSLKFNIHLCTTANISVVRDLLQGLFNRE